MNKFYCTLCGKKYHTKITKRGICITHPTSKCINNNVKYTETQVKMIELKGGEEDITIE